MNLHITLKENSDLPLYRQIADAIYSEIIGGRLAAGDKLPTVRELSDEMGISRGTIKHAYEYLENSGIIEMIQGKGTFVLGAEENISSRKEKAMLAIDRLLQEMENLGFTPREIEIYLKLKLQGLEERYDFVKVAIVDCNPETIKQIEKQLSEIEFLETASFPLNQIGDVAEKLNSEYDIVLTSSNHYGEVEAMMRDVRRLAMLALVPTQETLITLARLNSEERAGVVCASSNFGRIIRTNCTDMGEWSRDLPEMHFGSEKKLEEFLRDKTTVIVPKYFEAFASSGETQLILQFEKDGGRLIRYNYAVDRGSFLYVEQLVKRTLNKKRSV